MSHEASLAGRNIAVTGAAQGVGFGIVEELLSQDANVVMLDRDGDTLSASAEKARAAGGGTVLSFTADVTNIDGVRSAFASACSQLGSLDGLVNNAGIIRMGAASESTAEDWQSQMNVNVVGVVNCCNAFRECCDGSGSIVNIASNAGKVGYPNMAAYNASKAAVISLSRTLAAEWAPDINVNAICPGGVLTPMLENVAEVVGTRIGEKADKLLSTMVPAQLNRHIQPREVGRIAAFLLSDAAVIIRGQSINVDGGDTPY
ncbi:MAG: SDR family oxidoreductase [Gammaproteobacteria bacterium]|nr:SDR family oxidoreductase [Gammaproteobacteria bacterium]